MLSGLQCAQNHGSHAIISSFNGAWERNVMDTRQWLVCPLQLAVWASKAMSRLFDKVVQKSRATFLLLARTRGQAELQSHKPLCTNSPKIQEAHR